MSETVHYRGTLVKLERFENESLEDQCKRLLNYQELPSYWDNYQEYLLDEKYKEVTIQNGNVYMVTKEEIDPDYDIYKAKENSNGDIEFEVRYYNGGCGFEEAIESALDNIE